MNIDFFNTDEHAEVFGIWKTIGQGTRIKVARSGNSNYKKLIREKLAEYTAMGVSSIPDEEWTKIQNGVLAETILLDWEGLEEKPNELVDYSTEKAAEWLNKYKEFRKIVLLVADNVDNYRNVHIKEVKENIKK